MRHNMAVIVDVDGTLCDVRPVRHHVMQEPKDFHAFHAGAANCPPHREAVDWAIARYDAGYTVVVVTARRYEWERQTTEWVREHLPIPFLGPFMRGDTDHRPDTEVKRTIYTQLVEDHGLEIMEAIDDNPAVIKLWKELGLKVTEMPGWNSFYPHTQETYSDGTFPIGGLCGFSTPEEHMARVAEVAKQPVRATPGEHRDRVISLGMGAFDELAPSKGLMQVDPATFESRRSLYEGRFPTPEEP